MKLVVRPTQALGGAVQGLDRADQVLEGAIQVLDGAVQVRIRVLQEPGGAVSLLVRAVQALDRADQVRVRPPREPMGVPTELLRAIETLGHAVELLESAARACATGTWALETEKSKSYLKIRDPEHFLCGLEKARKGFHSMTSSNDFILPRSVGEVEDTLKTLYEGIQNQMPANATWTVDGNPIAKADLSKKVYDYWQTFKAPRDQEQAFHTSTRVRDAAEPEVKSFLADMLVTLQSQVGRTSEALANFGFRPRKVPTPLTTEQQSERVAKARVTRQKNHTMGSQQKKAADQGGATPPATGNSTAKP